jgi:hypothetical protein
MRRIGYEKDAATFPADAYRVKGYSGIAFWIWGWETEPTEETEWSGMEERTGKVLATMVGDDRKHAVDPDDLTPLGKEDYCGGCGQIGCHCG